MAQTVKIKIGLTPENQNQLVSHYGNNFLTKGLAVEIWQVVYRDVFADTNNDQEIQTQIYLEKRYKTRAIKKALVKNSIEINISGIPEDKSYAVFYHFKSAPEFLKNIHLGSLPNDGSQRQQLRFACNIHLTHPSITSFGMVSVNSSQPDNTYMLELLPSKTSDNNIAFKFSWSSIWDRFKDVADFVWEGGKRIVGVVVNTQGTIIVQSYGIIRSLVRDDGVVIPRYRNISEDEYNWANSEIFADTLPPRDHIVITNLLGFGGRAFVFPTSLNLILMNLGSKGYNDGRDIGKATFIHELTHVWQIYNYSDLHFTTKSIVDQCKNFTGSVYDYKCGEKWNDYNFEQQASIVENCYAERSRNKFSSCEQPYVENNIRKGLIFPPQRSLECQQLIDKIYQKNQELKNREKELKLMQLEEDGETAALHADGSRKVGTEKGISRVNLSASTLNKDAIYVSLKKELEALKTEKVRINCQ